LVTIENEEGVLAHVCMCTSEGNGLHMYVHIWR